MGFLKTITKLIFKPPPEPIPKVMPKPKPKKRRRRTPKKIQQLPTESLNQSEFLSALESGALLGKITGHYEEIRDILRSIPLTMAKEKTLEQIHKNMAREKTLKDLQKGVAKEDTLKRIDEQHYKLIEKIIFDKLDKGLNSGKPILDIKKDTEMFIDNISKESRKQFNQTKEKVELKIFERSKKLIIDALKHNGSLPFGDDKCSYGLTEVTKLSRSWLYKACYLGWNSKGTALKPEKNTLLAQGRIKVDRSGNRFTVTLNKGTN
jgi:hypothetical protein